MKNQKHLFLAFCLLQLFYTSFAFGDDAIYCDCDNPKSTSVDFEGYVSIGGIDQWVTITGNDCANPVVLFLHGGPGNTLSPYADALYDQWKSEFTLVQWDQRGAGKTFEANQKSGELNIDNLNKNELTLNLMVSDGLELTQYLKETLLKEKIILTGSSWGSVLAIEMISKHPENYQLYVGLSQVVNFVTNEQKSYESVLERAIEQNDTDVIMRLETLGSPPWSHPRNFGQFRQIIRQYERPVVFDQLQWQMSPQYLSENSRAAYLAGEEFSFIKFYGLKGDGMIRDIKFDKNNLTFEIPVFLVQGREDLLTTPEVTQAYFDSIKAPSKELIYLEATGHNTNHLMLEAQLNLLRKSL